MIAAKPGQKVPDDERRAVGRTIIDHDSHFPHGEVLLENAGDKLLDIAVVIIRVDQD